MAKYNKMHHKGVVDNVRREFLRRYGVRLHAQALDEDVWNAHDENHGVVLEGSEDDSEAACFLDLKELHDSLVNTYSAIDEDMVEDLRAVLERALPAKADGHTAMLNEMDKAGESDKEKFKSLVLSAADWFMYGN